MLNALIASRREQATAELTLLSFSDSPRQSSHVRLGWSLILVLFLSSLVLDIYCIVAGICRGAPAVAAAAAVVVAAAVQVVRCSSLVVGCLLLVVCCCWLSSMCAMCNDRLIALRAEPRYVLSPWHLASSGFGLGFGWGFGIGLLATMLTSQIAKLARSTDHPLTQQLPVIYHAKDVDRGGGRRNTCGP